MTMVLPNRCRFRHSARFRIAPGSRATRTGASRRCRSGRGLWAAQLPATLGGVEMPLRRGNQAVAPDPPFLKATDADPAARASRPGVRAGQCPVVLGLIAL